MRNLARSLRTAGHQPPPPSRVPALARGPEDPLRPGARGRRRRGGGRAHPPRYLVLGRRVRLAGRPLPQLRHAGHWRARSPQRRGAQHGRPGPGDQSSATRLLALDPAPPSASAALHRSGAQVSLSQPGPLVPPQEQTLGTSAHAHCRHLGPGDPPMARLHQGGVAIGAGRSRVERNALDSSLRGREKERGSDLD